MPDPNKLAKLASIGYVLQRCCGTCLYGSFPDRLDWGSCRMHGYVHAKHSAEVKPLSIHRAGRCMTWVENEKKAQDQATSGFDRFLARNQAIPLPLAAETVRDALLLRWERDHRSDEPRTQATGAEAYGAASAIDWLLGHGAGGRSEVLEATVLAATPARARNGRVPPEIHETSGPPDPAGRVRQIVREDRDAGP